MMIDDDNGSQMIFGDLGGLKLPDISLIGEEKPRKYLTQETCPDRGSNTSPLRDRRACYHLLHSSFENTYKTIILPVVVYCCETWFLTLKEKHRLRVFENKISRKIFRTKRDEITG